MIVPKLIHQIWIDQHVPERFVGFRDGWRRLNPDWTYRLWTDADILAFVQDVEPGLLPVFEGHARAICRADIARYLILKHHGGLYVDLDFECLRPVEPLLDAAQFAIGVEPDRHRPKDGAWAHGASQILCPSLIASVPRHPFWDAVTTALVAARDEADVLDATGPYLLTRTYERVRAASGAADITILPADTIYPFDKFECWDGRLFDIEAWERRTREAYAIHHWHGGWFRGDHASRPRELKVIVDGPGPKTIPPQAAPSPPLVSCLMTTRDRLAQALLAIRCFRAQTYPTRELVIVDDSADDSLGRAVSGDPQIRYVRGEGRDAVLGRARNQAVAAASGSYICQWDDDDLYDPLRIEMQMAALRHTGAQACILERWMMWWPEQNRLAVSKRRAWEGSLLCERSAMPAYPELRRGEDTPVLDALLAERRVVRLDEPRLYLYVVHGGNTFSAAHFDEHWTAAAPRFVGERYGAVLGEIGKRLPVAEYRAAEAGQKPPDADDDARVAAARLLVANRLDEAEAAFEQVRRRRPDLADGLDGLARVAGRRGDWLAAISLWDELQVLFPERLTTLLGRGHALLELGRFDEAEQTFEEARSRHADLNEPLIGLAETAARSRNWPLATKRWQTLRARLPQAGQPIVGLINCHVELGDFAAAEAEYAAGVEHLAAEDRVMARAMILQRRHRNEELAALFAAHAEIVAGNASLRALQFEVLQVRGDADLAVATLLGPAAERPENQPFVTALRTIYGVETEAPPAEALATLHGFWAQHGAAMATPDLLAPLVSASHAAEGEAGALALLAALDALPLTSARNIKLRILAVFERLRLQPERDVAEDLRRLAARADPRAPFGYWREALYRIAHHDERLRAAFPGAAIDSAWRESAARRVRDDILDAVAKKRPFSLIRLGDGEGNFLAYPRERARFAAIDRDATQRIWWGEPRLSPEAAEMLGGELETAVRRADIVGVPDASRLCAGLSLPCPRDLYASWHDMRGLLVLVHHMMEAAEPGTAQPLLRADQLLTSCHIHADLAAFELYEELFAQISAVSLITCHAALPDRLAERFGVVVTRTILIPHERKYGAVFGYSDAEEHFPHAFDRLRHSLEPEPGEVFVVAAGFLGKLYCDWIKQRGGIALDLGSIVDHWCGFPTRTLQFRQRYRSVLHRKGNPGAPRAQVPPPSVALPDSTQKRTRSYNIARGRRALDDWDVAQSGPIGVNLFAEIGIASGIGLAGAGLARAISAAGIPAHVIDPHAPARGDLRRFPINIVHMNPWTLVNKEMWSAGGPFDADLFSHRFNIGCWAWESTTTFPAEWLQAFHLVDEVWVPSRFSAEGVRTVSPVPVHVVPHALDLERLQEVAHPPDGHDNRFRFLFIFDELSGFERKNPLGLIAAYRQAFPSGEAELVIKARTLSAERHVQLQAAIAGHRSIALQVGEISRADILALIAGCDAYVSLHRAEGFGLTLAEAMALGKPVIATGYSGVLDYLDHENGYLVPFSSVTLDSARESYPAGTVWAEPDTGAAARLMRRVFENRSEAALIARKGQATVRTLLSDASIGAIVRNRLEAIARGARATPRKPAQPAAQDPPPREALPHVLVLTPMRDASHSLDLYFQALESLAYPVDRLTLAFLEGDSSDDTAAMLKSHVERLSRAGRQVRAISKDFGVRYDAPRWSDAIQRVRRSGIAKARNWLLNAALDDQAAWVLWIDADVISYPPDSLRQLLAAKQDIVVPHCVLTPGGPTFDLNTFRRTRNAAHPPPATTTDGLLQPARGDGRAYLDSFRGRGAVELDSVGGTMLLVRADLHREGLIFPTIPINGLIETEAFALMAKEAGYRCCGLPDLEIIHASA